MLIRANSGHAMRPRDSGDYTVNDGSFLSASTLASSGVTAQVSLCSGRWGVVTGWQSENLRD